MDGILGLYLNAAYWLVIQVLIYICAICILVSGVDDLFVDICYWTRRVYRNLRGKEPDAEQQHAMLDEKPQQSIAMIVPAWDESAVIGKMLDNTLKRLDYHNYCIFVGVYPNDTATARAVSSIAATDPRVNMVTTSKPGPTTKADCLNQVIQHIFQIEKDQQTAFDMIIYHDAEDVIHPLELKLFNYHIPDHDMVQVPVLPYPKRWYHFTTSTYMDEFCEYHSKDTPIRESISGNVCSAGTGTAFSRTAIQTLQRLNGVHVFDEASLTEDYEISYRLHENGLRQHFAVFPTPEDDVPVLAVRAFFPGRFRAAARQKSRWLVGILFQARWNIGWPWRRLSMVYCLMRDRKALLTNPLNVLAYFVVLNLLFKEVLELYLPTRWYFPALIPRSSWIWYLLLCNGFVLLNRLVQRVYFIRHCYGSLHGLLSIPRVVWGNLINFSAYWQALKRVRTNNNTRNPPTWEKTDHEYPELP